MKKTLGLLAAITTAMALGTAFAGEIDHQTITFTCAIPQVVTLALSNATVDFNFTSDHDLGVSQNGYFAASKTRYQDFIKSNAPQMTFAPNSGQPTNVTVVSNVANWQVNVSGSTPNQLPQPVFADGDNWFSRLLLKIEKTGSTPTDPFQFTDFLPLSAGGASAVPFLGGTGAKQGTNSYNLSFAYVTKLADSYDFNGGPELHYSTPVTLTLTTP